MSDAIADRVPDPFGPVDLDLEGLLTHLGVMPSQRNPPAAKSIVDTLPTFKVTADEFSQGISCAVCLEPFPLSSHPTRLPCFHLYHKECVVEWLKKHNSCPTCRYELDTDDLHYNEEKTRKRIESASPPPSMFG